MTRLNGAAFGQQNRFTWLEVLYFPYRIGRHDVRRPFADIQRSPEIQVPVHEIETWRKDFLDAGMMGLKRRGGDPEERALKQTQAKVGELTMRLELAELLLEKRGYADELARLKKSRGW